MNLLCLLKGCKVSQTIHGSPNNFYVISVSGSSNAQFLSGLLRTISGIQNVVLINTGDSPLGNRFIVHTNGGLLNLQSICNLGLCQIIEPLDGTLNQVFLLAAPSSQDPSLVLAILRAVPGVLNVELDQLVSLGTGSAQATDPPPSLVDTTSVQYFGSPVWQGYINQPAAQIIQLAYTQQTFGVSGIGKLNNLCEIGRAHV